MLMIYTTRASLLSSTRKLRFSNYGFLLRNLNTAAERLGFDTENPTGNSANHTGYINGFNSRDQLLGGFQQSLNLESVPVSGHNRNVFYQNSSIDRYNQDESYGETSSFSYGSGNRAPQENVGLVHSQTFHNSERSLNANELQVQSHNQANGEDSGENDSLKELDAICREGKVIEAVDIIKSWRKEGYVVDLPRLLWLVQLCGDAKALPEAKVVHEFITSVVPLSDISTYKLVIEMYSACGSGEDALTVFNSLPEKNSETWCAIIRCFAENGQGEDAIDMFSRFKEEGNIPDGEIFKEIFFTCGVLGDIDEGLLHFESMIKDYGIIPSVEHYVSLVKMLAAPGYLDEALGFVESMEPNVDLWETLMNLSRVHGDLELSDRCQGMVEKLDASRLNRESKVGLVPVNPSDLVKERLQRLAKGNNFTFGSMAAGDISRPENREYYMALKGLMTHIAEIGYVPESKLALHDVLSESKDENLFNHNEKFAFIVNFLSTPARFEVKVIKNLRVCIDCHNALKFMSKIVGRVLVSRDTKRFHHMKDGVCSCRDYW